MYDVIGDIHGYAEPLRRLLTRLGYRENHGNWKHPTRTAVFLGDFIDRGPEQVAVVDIVRTMVENGDAIALMGNHEFAAVAWTTPDPEHPGAFLRRHTERRRRKHGAFLEQVGENSVLHKDIISWFRTLPLFLELDGFRAIHACWHRDSLNIIKAHTDDANRIREDAWHHLTREQTPAGNAIDTLLKGPELCLPNGRTFADKDGAPRKEIRTKWWCLESRTYHSLALVPQESMASIPHDPAPEHHPFGYDGSKPLFVGHYWLTGRPAPLSPHVACLDYSVAAANTRSRSPGKLCAYRWEGESELREEGFIWV